MPRLHQDTMSPGYMYPGWATCIRIHICQRIHFDGYKLLVRDTCGLYLGDIITIHLRHNRLVSICIQQKTGDKLAIQDTMSCRRRQVDTSGYNMTSWCKRGIRVTQILRSNCVVGLLGLVVSLVNRNYCRKKLLACYLCAAFAVTFQSAFFLL